MAEVEAARSWEKVRGSQQPGHRNQQKPCFPLIVRQTSPSSLLAKLPGCIIYCTPPLHQLYSPCVLLVPCMSSLSVARAVCVAQWGLLGASADCVWAPTGSQFNSANLGEGAYFWILQVTPLGEINWRPSASGLACWDWEKACNSKIYSLRGINLSLLGIRWQLGEAAGSLGRNSWEEASMNGVTKEGKEVGEELEIGFPRRGSSTNNASSNKAKREQNSSAWKASS